MVSLDTLSLLNHTDPDAAVRLVTKALVPGWADLDDADIKVERLEMGITNRLFLAKTKLEKNANALVRVYGAKTEEMIDRARELKLLDELTQLKAGAQLYGTFKDGYVYEYLAGRPLTHLEMAEPRFIEPVAKKMADWHKLPIKSIPSSPKGDLWETLRDWITKAPRKFADDKKNTHLEAMGIERMSKEIDILQALLEPLKAPVVFTHNDLLSANIIWNEADDSINFIDFEYACFNPRGFDIGNHFDEYVGFDLDFTLYPSAEQQRVFCRAYLGPDARDAEVNALQREADGYSLASHLLWSIWALLQAKNSDLDFDFMDYGHKRLDEYFRRKALLFPPSAVKAN